ncbi:carbonic anhydrase family protein [uncultured Propionivibrio sp.]|uniref:carbonic anhydrase n=1 Tax=uncultured Propionivibrio sp. TaxID=426737 RepID=UPI0029C0E8F7|nr:carbonic anhydrase family protein [uncultured Propionivibrio sp.]
MGRKIITAAVLAVLPALAVPPCALAAWQLVATEQGKRVEIERDSIATGDGGEIRVRGRIVLDRSIIDPRTSSLYRVIEIYNRFDCSERTYATLKRSYIKENGELLRQEEVRMPDNMPVRSGTPDDRLFREACRPGSSAGARPVNLGQTVDRVNEAASELRQVNQMMIDKEVKKEASRSRGRIAHSPDGLAGGAARNAKKSLPAPTVAWAYEGAGAPERWAAMRSEYAVCAFGNRQSPIDIRDGIAVDLEPIQFSYSPVKFKVVDAGRSLLVMSYGGAFGLLGKNYALTQMLFHRPGETTVGGRSFDMEVQLMHRAEDGQQAIVSILLERGAENPVIQSILNNLPLERGGEVAPVAQLLDLERLLPAERRYYAFMGSLTMPPCTEDVLWLVLKQTQSISSEQLAIFQRLYPPNARPVQPGSNRIIKESR